MSLRVMTYNILDGGGNRETYILDVIRTVNPDIVILQEVFTEEFLKSLSHSLGMNYFIGSGNQQVACSYVQKSPSSFPYLAQLH